jgi:diguanylate cyclase (GGDEF)-like protein
MNTNLTHQPEIHQTASEQLLTASLFVGNSMREDFPSAVQRLEEDNGPAVYSDLIYLLSHLQFQPDVAKEHWLEILLQHQDMERTLGSRVELQVALLRYFTQIHPTLINPKIIEQSTFAKTQRSIYLDELTGVRNYRFFIENMHHEVRRSEQYGAPFSLIMADVDRFKQYNDRNGHEAGNAALKQVAELLTASVRCVDTVARYGGEEFAIILPATQKLDAEFTAERIRAAIEAHHFASVDSESEAADLTVSFGVATYPGDAMDEGELIQNADRALYHAKSAGRNRVCLYGSNSRSFPRREANLEGTAHQGTQDKFPLRVMEIGEGGMLFQAQHEMVVGTIIQATLRIPGSTEDSHFSCRVLRVIPKESGLREAAVRFLELTHNDRWQIRNFVNGQ